MNPFHSPTDRPGDHPGGLPGAGPRRPDDAGDFEARLRACYLQAGQPIDPATAGRLRAARRTALQAMDRSPAHTLHRRWLPAGAFAVLALATLAIWQPADHQTAPPPSPATMSASAAQEADADLPPDADSAEDAQLYQNLAFYDWLASSERAPAEQ
jgi:hypothetical protein